MAFVPWLPMELNREMWRTAHAFVYLRVSGYLWQTYISICSIFRTLQGAVIELFICDIFKNPFDIPTKSYVCR